MKCCDSQVRVQTLERNNFNQGSLYRLKKNWKLKLKLSTNLISENIRVFCNLPPNNEEFDRSKFYEYICN